MAGFSRAQKSACVLWLAEYHDIEAVQRKFKEKFCINEESEIPTESEIFQWYKSFHENGIIEKEGPEEDLEGKTRKHSMIGSSNVDIHAIDYEKEMGSLNFLGIKKVVKFHRFKMHLKEPLTIEDKIERERFAQHQFIHLPTHHINQLWFGGDAKFYANGRVECHNLVYMSEDSNVPESKQAPPAEGPCLTVWAGLSSDGILGPYIFSGDATISIYQLFLSKFVYELQQIYRYQPELHKPIFIHDDSEIHNCFNEFLDKEFPNHWIGPGSQYSSWPRLSPDINPLCFFLWAHIKNQVFKRLIVPGDSALIYRIHEAFISITPEMLKQALKDYQDRLNTVFERNGDLVDVHYDKESQEINDVNQLKKKALI